MVKQHRPDKTNAANYAALLQSGYSRLLKPMIVIKSVFFNGFADEKTPLRWTKWVRAPKGVAKILDFAVFLGARPLFVRLKGIFSSTKPLKNGFYYKNRWLLQSDHYGYITRFKIFRKTLYTICKGFSTLFYKFGMIMSKNKYRRYWCRVMLSEYRQDT